MFFSYLCVGIGGAVGAITRVALASILPPFAFNLPIKILIVNVLGCFLLGALVEIFAMHGQIPRHLQHLLIQGFLGGFTTFSAFALEFHLLSEQGSHVLAVIYAILSVVLSIVFFFAGMRIPRLFLS